ncbi:hypothetical protein ASC61_18435 [Aeromicrobium sp. Root344]|uniref:hypothetical protein n=1 Tax=Aeromicrobium sp. Root344 TaxID=1736521 RepID=UPI0006FA0F4C|nr:hypothetical protein [Aeromicrobium sp. Root344]KQV76816.1 hypothetical protein ASC61_18435 [Aeromicrobium sp. Root344]
MMKKQIAALVLGVSVAGGIGAGVLANALTTNTPAAAADDDKGTYKTIATPPTRAAPATLKDMVISPGRLGDVRIGMSKKEALATGLFDADTPPPVDGCPVLPLTWKKTYGDLVDVGTLGNGEISSIGIRDKAPRTEDGLGVGSTYGEVRAAIEDGKPVEAGYSQSGLYEYDPQTGGWIGYLFDATVDQLKDSDPVTFVEITKNAQPGLMRDGC